MPCPLKCWTEGEAVAEDTQQHLLFCSKLSTEFQSEELAKGQVVYEDIFGEVNKQKEAVVLFSKLMEVREKVLQDRDNQPPEDILDPSMGNRLCCVDTVFTAVVCINCVYNGK